MKTLLDLLREPGHIVLCGDIDSGKSSFLFSQVPALFTQGLSLGGWITPPYREEGRKCGHDFVALQRHRFEDAIPFTREHPFPDAFSWMRYWFHHQAFARAEHLPQDVDCFLMDEIGPLELHEHRGFYDVAQRAYRSCPCTLTVLRHGLEMELKNIAPAHTFHFVPIDALRA